MWINRSIDYPDFLIRIEMCEEFIHTLASNHLSENRDLPIIIEDLPKDDVKFKLFSNLNIIAQEGLFIASADPEKSVEECLNSYIEILCQKYSFGKDKVDEVRIRQREKFRCFNVHKSLKPGIKNFLDKEFGINRDSIFPDLYKLPNYCCDTFGY